MITNGRTKNEKIDDRALARSGGVATFCGIAFIFFCGFASGAIWVTAFVQY